MQCPVCGFENMPGTDACVRCRARLKVTGPVAAGDYVPPRSRTPRSLRAVRYALNRVLDRLPARMPRGIARLFTGGTHLPGNAVAAMCLSVVPGLGHLLDGRRRRALAGVGVWLLAAVLAANFYVGFLRWLLLSFLVTWHALVVFDAGRVSEHAPDARARVRVILPVALLASCGYFLLDRAVHLWVDFVPCPYGIRALRVEAGDALLVRRGNFTPRVGDLIAVGDRDRPLLRVRQGVYLQLHGSGLMLARVLALAGQEVTVSQGGLWVDGRKIDAGELPDRQVPLPRTAVSFRVPGGAVLAVTPMRGPPHAYGVDVAAQVWQNTFLVPESSVEGRAVGVYLPLRRRRFLQRGPGS